MGDNNASCFDVFEKVVAEQFSSSKKRIYFKDLSLSQKDNSSVYITGTVKCTCPVYRSPRKGCGSSFLKFKLREIETGQIVSVFLYESLASNAEFLQTDDHVGLSNFTVVRAPNVRDDDQELPVELVVRPKSDELQVVTMSSKAGSFSLPGKCISKPRASRSYQYVSLNHSFVDNEKYNFYGVVVRASRTSATGSEPLSDQLEMVLVDPTNERIYCNIRAWRDEVFPDVRTNDIVRVHRALVKKSNNFPRATCFAPHDLVVVKTNPEGLVYPTSAAKNFVFTREDKEMAMKLRKWLSSRNSNKCAASDNSINIINDQGHLTGSKQQSDSPANSNKHKERNITHKTDARQKTGSPLKINCPESDNEDRQNDRDMPNCSRSKQVLGHLNERKTGVKNNDQQPEPTSSKERTGTSSKDNRPTAGESNCQQQQENTRQQTAVVITNPGNFASLDTGLYRDVVCLLIAIKRLPFRQFLILSVWDGTAPCKNLRISTDANVIACNPDFLKVLQDKVLDVWIYDTHVPVAENLLPGSFIVLRNLHMYVPKYLKPDGPAELSLHSGTDNNRGIFQLSETCADVQFLKERLRWHTRNRNPEMQAGNLVDAREPEEIPSEDDEVNFLNVNQPLVKNVNIEISVEGNGSTFQKPPFRHEIPATSREKEMKSEKTSSSYAQQINSERKTVPKQSSSNDDTCSLNFLEEFNMKMEPYSAALQKRKCPFAYIKSNGVYQTMSRTCTELINLTCFPPVPLDIVITHQVPYMHRFVAVVEDLKPPTVQVASDLVWMVCEKCLFGKPFNEMGREFASSKKKIVCISCKNGFLKCTYMMEFKLRDCKGTLFAVLRGDNAVIFFRGIQPEEVLDSRNPKSKFVCNITRSLCPRVAPKNFKPILPSRFTEFCVISFPSELGIMYEVVRTQFSRDFYP